ncbi:9-O-acetylesterase, partial [bacterium]|nr:9-O-acetylesterase [bacterium]
MKIFTILFFVCIITFNAFAQLKLPAVISDNMVLQREMDVPVWGWATPKAVVTVKFMGQTKSTVSDAEGCWEIKLNPISATGKPQKMLIESNGDIVTLKNILVGEVWVCSGQSNMEFPMEMLKNAKEEITKAQDSQIRFLVIDKQNFKPYECDDCKANWIECSPKTVEERTAVGYYFARELREKLDVPVGLIEANFGGASIEAWSSADTLSKWEKLKKELAYLGRYKNNKRYNRLKKKEVKEWFKELKKSDKGFSNNWMNVDTPLTGWKKIKIPAKWNDVKKLKGFKGTVWLRRKIDIPAEWKGKNLIVEPWAIDGYDTIWLNGKKIGTLQRPHLFWRPRHYEVDESEYKVGENVITICIYNKDSAGGMASCEELMKIFPEGEPDKSIPFAGEWYYKKGYEGKKLPEAPIPFRIAHHTPTVLYNSMLAPIIPFGIRGALWYQGESNVQNPYEYRKMFPDMIKDWRKEWEQGIFPFYYVQIAPYNYGDKVNSALLREAQLLTMKTTNTGMAVTMDIGNPDDIHPKNKKDV